MTRLEWGLGPRMFDLGVDHGVLYLDGTAVPWNGLIFVEELAVGSIDTDHYFEGNRVHISHELGDFRAKLSAYTYPDAFAEYNGLLGPDQYKRFGFSYRTQHEDESSRIHLVYNAQVQDDVRAWGTVGAKPDTSLFSWDIYASAEMLPGGRPGSHISMEAPRDPEVLANIEDILYGTDGTEPRLPGPEEILALYEGATLLRITYNGDGTYTASGPDDMVRDLGNGRFEIDSPTAFHIKEDKFIVNSY